MVVVQSKYALIIVQMILAISSNASSRDQLDRRFELSMHNMVDFKIRPDVISSKFSFTNTRLNLNLRGGGIPFEGADGPAVNDYIEEENEAFVEEHGNDEMGEENPAHHRRDAAQAEKLEEQSRSSHGIGL
jgi:hypothetical protein